MARILVPLDGSELAEHSLPWAALVGSALGDTVHLLSVADVEQQLFEYAQIDPQASLPHAERELDAYFASVIARADLPERAAVTHEVLPGDPATVIASVAGGPKVDAIVITTHGQGRASREDGAGPGYGSVTYKLVRSVTRPMLVVPPAGAPASLTSFVATLDGSRNAERVLPLARKLAAGTGAKLHLLRVVDPDIRWVLPREQTEDLVARHAERAKAYLDHIAGEGEQTAVIHGKCAAAIAAYAREQECEVIALASHGRGGSLPLELGSTAEAVLQTTDRPVLVVPIRE